jgi:hypothetical protein
MGIWLAFKLIALSAATLVAFACAFRLLCTVGPRAAEPCSSCGYCVRGLSAMVCPECGADLSTVGYYPEGVRAPVSRPTWSAVWVGLWSLALLVPTLLVSHMITDMVCPCTVVVQANQTVTLQPDRLHASVTMTASGSALAWGKARAHVVRVTLLEAEQGRTPIPFFATLSLSVPQSPRLEIEVPPGDWRLVDGTGGTLEDGKAFDARAIERWLTVAGYDVRSLPDWLCASFCDWIPSYKIWSSRGRRLSREQAGSLLKSKSITGTNSIRIRTPWYSTALPMLPWLAVWWWGCRRIRRGYPQIGIKPLTMDQMPS